jgi:hypothetical protein
MKKLVLAVLATTIPLTGCDTIDSHNARKAQVELVGMRRAAFFACAGLPNRSRQIEGAEYDTYDFQPYTNQFNATFPLIGSIGIGSSGSCHATAIFRNDTLMEIDYAGDTGGILGHVAECVTIVNHCQDGAKEATGRY